MSLTVSLFVPGPSEKGSGIWVRENGSVREISRAEWDERFPGVEPFTVDYDDHDDGVRFVYSDNITSNLSTMAEAAGIYKHLWRPEELNITKAEELINPLTRGLNKLRESPDVFTIFNPSNGWGNYEGLVEFVQNYLTACEKYPMATIYVSR